MSEGKFRENEVVCIDEKAYPLLKGRLRLALESTQSIVVRSELLRFDPGVVAVCRVSIELSGGMATAHGVASADRDPEFVGALAELSESRAISRALRWLGHGLEVGFEELGPDRMRNGGPAVHPIREGARRVQGSPGLARGDRPNSSGPPCTAAQRRVLVSLARQLGRDLDEVVESFDPGTLVRDLTLAQASLLIDRLKARTMQNAGVGR